MSRLHVAGDACRKPDAGEIAVHAGRPHARNEPQHTASALQWLPMQVERAWFLCTEGMGGVQRVTVDAVGELKAVVSELVVCSRSL
jgi:hypothetical protein